MARQCLMVAIMHKPATESSTFAKGGLQQLKSPMLLVDGLAEEVKCEDLEKVVVGEDWEKVLSGEMEEEN